MEYWTLEKFNDNTNMFAICPVCGFSYAACDTTDVDDNGNISLVAFNYCPVCGENLKLRDTPGYGSVWNEREMAELTTKKK